MKTSISQTISILRFPLCVVIVMIHSNIALYNASANQFTSIHILSNYIIGDICFYSLALFFFISGFLLFREGNFNLDIFKNKIIHRVYSLLIPGFNTYYLYFFILGAYFSINHSSWVLSQKSLIGFMVAYGVLFSIRIVYQSDIKIIEETLFIFIILNVVHLLTKKQTTRKYCTISFRYKFLCFCHPPILYIYRAQSMFKNRFPEWLHAYIVLFGNIFLLRHVFCISLLGYG